MHMDLKKMPNYQKNKDFWGYLEEEAGRAKREGKRFGGSGLALQLHGDLGPTQGHIGR